MFMLSSFWKNAKEKREQSFKNTFRIITRMKNQLIVGQYLIFILNDLKEKSYLFGFKNLRTAVFYHHEVVFEVCEFFWKMQNKKWKTRKQPARKNKQRANFGVLNKLSSSSSWLICLKKPKLSYFPKFFSAKTIYSQKSFRQDARTVFENQPDETSVKIALIIDSTIYRSDKFYLSLRYNYEKSNFL